MGQETLLTFMDISCSDECIANAITMAENANAHLSVVLIASAPQLYLYGIPYAGYDNVEHWNNEVIEISNALDEKANQIETLVQTAGISAEILTEYCDFALIQATAVRHANIADRAVLLKGNGLTDDIEDAIMSGIIFDSPIGIFIGPNAHVACVNPSNIFIAWNSGNHVSVAVHNALPLLLKADQATVAIFDAVKTEGADGEEQGADLASWLSRHGCNVTIEQYATDGDEVGDCITKRALEKGADLVVMGGYGHIKLRQQIFGGTTKTMLNQEKISILVAHK